MLDIITRKIEKAARAVKGFFCRPPFLALCRNIHEATHTTRFAMLSTYIGVTLVTLVLMCVYIIGILSENLYSEKTTKLFAKANIISMTVADEWDSEDTNVMYLRFEDIIERSLAGTSIRGVITNTSYTVLYDNNSEADMIGKVFMRDVLKRGVDGEQAESMFDSDSGRTITVSVPIEREGVIIGGVYLAENVSSISETVDTIKTSLIVFSALIILIMIMLSIGISYIITQPMAEFIDVAHAISKGDFSRRAAEKGTSEMVQMGRALNYMCDELNTLDEKRKNFVSDVSHELKTPMAGIKLLCDSLVEAENPSMDTVREFLGDMSEEIDRLTRLINRLLTLSRLDAGASLNMSEVDITMMAVGVIRSLKQLAAEKNISIDYDIKLAKDKNAVVDYDKIYEALYNIIDNAIKYTPDGGIVKIQISNENGFCVISVEDNGPGIPDAEKQKVFDRFYRLDDSRARDTGGTGLGLAIAREAVLLHGGDIEILDAPEGGSIFKIKIPFGHKEKWTETET